VATTELPPKHNASWLGSASMSPTAVLEHVLRRKTMPPEPKLPISAAADPDPRCFEAGPP